MSVTGTNLFRLRETEKHISSAQESTNSSQQVSESEVSTEPDVKDKPRIKLPALNKTRRLNREEKNDLQALLRIRCYDFSLQVQGLQPEVKNSSRNSSFSSGSQSLEDSADQSQEETKKDSEESDKDSWKDKSSVLTLPSSTVLEGQRVDLKEKNGLDNERSHIHCKPTDEGNKPLCLNDLRSENYRLENMIRSTIASLKRRKQNARPVFHLPKVDKYDITPGHNKNGKICSVFKLNDVKSSSIYSGFKDSWIPQRDRYFMSNSEFFKSLYMQPTVLLRQPSPVAGVKINLREHEEDSLVAAINAAKEMVDVQPPSVDTEVTKKVEKIVIRLPPIC